MPAFNVGVKIRGRSVSVRRACWESVLQGAGLCSEAADPLNAVKGSAAWAVMEQI